MKVARRPHTWCDFYRHFSGGTNSNNRYGPGDIAQAHTSEEWIDLSQLEQVPEVVKGFEVESKQLKQALAVAKLTKYNYRSSSSMSFGRNRLYAITTSRTTQPEKSIRAISLRTSFDRHHRQVCGNHF